MKKITAVIKKTTATLTALAIFAAVFFTSVKTPLFDYHKQGQTKNTGIEISEPFYDYPPEYEEN